jgi:retron-type reverse transcriptase
MLAAIESPGSRLKREFSSRTYEWVLEGDIEACFDNIDHTALMERVRRRVGGQARLVGGQGVPACGHRR